MVGNKYAKYVGQPKQEEPKAPAKGGKYAKYLQPVPAPTDAAPPADINAAIEETAAAIPGGYEAFKNQPVDPQRMARMGYVRDPLAPGGYAKPRAADAFETIQNNAPTRNLATDAARFIEAPFAGMTGGGLEGWAKTTSENPLLGAVQAVDFISPVDDAARAYQGVKQAGAGAIEGDWKKAGEGLKQAAIDGSFTAMQALPGSMTLKGLGTGRNALMTLADAERAAAMTSRAQTVAPQVVEPPQPVPFSAPSEPIKKGVIAGNTDRIVGGGVGAFLGSAGDALAAPGDGDQGGPDIINPVTGAAAGMMLPRLAARGYRGLRAGAAFDEKVAARAVRNVLAPAGKNADEIAAQYTARFGDKPAALADLTQQGVSFSSGLSRLPGNTAEKARTRAEDVMSTRTGRLFADVETTTKINPASVTADIDAAIKQASEEISPAYEKLFADNAGVNSERLMQLMDDPIIKPYLRRAMQASESLATTAGQAPSNARTWDLVKRGLDRAIEGQKRSSGQAAYELEKARAAIKDELDALMPEYKGVRDNADAPRMRDAREKAEKVMGGGMSIEKVRALASSFTGKPLTALQMGAIEKMVLDVEKGRGIEGLASERMREILGAVFDPQTADQLVARISADQTILKNSQRINPNVGAVTSQAGMSGAGGVQNMADLAQSAMAFKTNPLATVLAALSKSGTYTKNQRDLMGEMLLGGNTPENLARIYGNRGRNPLNVTPPPAPSAPPVNRLAQSNASPTVTGAVTGGTIGTLANPDDPQAGLVMGALGGGLAGYGAGKLGKGGRKPPPPPSRTVPPKGAAPTVANAEKILSNPAVARSLSEDQFKSLFDAVNNEMKRLQSKTVTLSTSGERIPYTQTREGAAEADRLNKLLLNWFKGEDGAVDVEKLARWSERNDPDRVLRVKSGRVADDLRDGVEPPPLGLDASSPKPN